MATEPAAAEFPGADALEHPRRSGRVELVGAMQGMSYADRRWLICVDGGQYVQATELLYHLLLFADGTNGVGEIARRVTEETGREVTADEVRWLVANKLAGSGLIEWPASAGPAAAPPVVAPNRLLAIKHRFPLLPYRLTAPFTEVLQHLYWPPLIVLVVLAAAAVNVWLYRANDLLNGVVTLFFRPELVLLLFAVDTVTRLFHELGHASALRRAGARHGTIGFALYVVFPVYYTDVTHAYRLSRAQRVRVDLGGIYFDLISMLVLYTIYRFTGYTPLLLMILLMGLGILRQFTPFIRFDGYYLIADLVGVPDPMPLMKALVADLLPWRRGLPRAMPKLHPLAVAVLWAYLLVIVAFLTRPLLLLTLAGGVVLQQLPASGVAVVAELLFAWRHHDLLTQLAATLELVFWALIPIGLGLFAFSLLRLLARILILLGRALGRVARRAWEAAGDRRVAVEVPAAPPLRAPAVLPTALDGLGRPVARRDNAAVEHVLERARAESNPAAGDVVDELERVYGRRLESVSADLERLLEWTRTLEQERAALQTRVESLEALLARLTVDLRRVGGEMLTAAAMAEAGLPSNTDAAPATAQTGRRS